LKLHVHVTGCIHWLVQERQLPRKIVNLIFRLEIVNNNASFHENGVHPLLDRPKRERGGSLQSLSGMRNLRAASIYDKFMIFMIPAASIYDKPASTRMGCTPSSIGPSVNEAEACNSVSGFRDQGLNRDEVLGRSIYSRPMCTRCYFTTTSVIQVCSNFH